jgi:phage shock protein E
VDSVVYVDVRTDSEFNAGHVEGALHIPYDQMEQRFSELEPYAGQEIVVYCRSGHRAGIAKGVLDQHGFSDVVNGGGLTDLQAEGIPTTADR